MNRAAALDRLADASVTWDVLVIGGGATGLGVAVDAASRGYRTALVEQSDFAKATSSRSTKLIHGGVRYLRQGNLKLVFDSLRERGLLMRNAPHLVHALPFIVPNYHWWEKPFYGIGLKLYDVMARKLSLGKTELLSKDEVIRALPTIEPQGLRGGVRYFDGQFDDARLAISLAQTADDHGAAMLNYVRVDALLKNNGHLCGAVAHDVETAREFQIKARCVINATGIFTDSMRQLDEPKAGPMLSVSQGVHLVLDRSFLPGDTAIMVPQTDDGRVLFVIPWHGKVVVGTTDTPMPEPLLEPRALDEEIAFLLHHTRKYLTKNPEESDILSIYAGLRPLVKNSAVRNTAALSRDHVVVVSASGMITITGGKWTTYRHMAEDTVNTAIKSAGLTPKPCVTASLRLHESEKSYESRDNLAAITQRAAREEMARTVEDVLARRTRLLLLDARASIKAAPEVAMSLARELQKDEAWRQSQIAAFTELAQQYLP